jgi:hypothetical protein
MWNLIFLLAIVFVLTYDPKSRTLETFIGQPSPSTNTTHYEAVQIPQTPYERPPVGRMHMGVIT